VETSNLSIVNDLKRRPEVRAVAERQAKTEDRVRRVRLVQIKRKRLVLIVWKNLLTWAQRLKRVFNIAIGTCRECGGALVDRNAIRANRSGLP